jgi:hypothetical protein
MAFTPNDFVRVKPTEAGWRAIRKYYESINRGQPIPDKDGYIKGQFWSIMQYFEWKMGRDNNFEDMILENKK